MSLCKHDVGEGLRTPAALLQSTESVGGIWRGGCAATQQTCHAAGEGAARAGGSVALTHSARGFSSLQRPAAGEGGAGAAGR